MHRTIALILVLTPFAFGQNKLSRQERKDGFQLLFDGKTLTHWHTIKRRPNNASWTVQKGILSYEKGESWLATDDSSYDFVLRLDYLTADKSDSGIFVHASPTGNPGTTGVEVNFISDAGKPATARSSGSLWDIVAPLKNLNKPDGQWNSVEISVVNRKLSEIWNGEKVLDVSLDDPQYPKLAGRMEYGYIGIQAHAFGEPVQFRNIRIKPIKLAPPFPPEK